MPRRRVVAKRPVMPDPKHGSRQVGRFINMVMRDGKKSVAEKIVYGALDLVAAKGKGDPLEVLARKRPEKTMGQRLAGEILEAAENRGAAVKKKEDTHRMAEANKAFAHYRW